MKVRFISICIFIFQVQLIFSQPWIESGIDSKGKSNFFRIREEAEKYFKNIPIQEKGMGYKAYKRWEYNWQDRVFEDGSFPDAGITERNFNEYLKSVRNQNRNINLANWSSLGPSTTPGGYAGLGRINCVAFHPLNNNIIWIGSPGGGLWKSTDGGNTWSTNFDNSVVLGVSSIVIHPSSPDIMYIATGDANNSDTQSTGVLKSTDGGVTWQTTGLNWTVSQQRRIRKLLMDPDDPNMLLAATSDGLYRTTNAGNNWTQLINLNFFDVEANPDPSTNIFYAASSSRLYTSSNNGSTWTEIINIASTNRIALAVSPNNANTVYALCSSSVNSGFNGLYRSTNAGTSYTLASSSPNILSSGASGTGTGGQGWYDLCIAADPNNANVLYTGGINCWKSTDGGINWTLKTHWSGAPGVQTVHADHHALDFQGTTLWLGCDGGIYKTTDGGNSWTDKSNGLIISQMYRLDVSQLDGKIITGLQDNGTKFIQTNGTWADRIGGDGMDCHIAPTNANVMYASYQNGNFFRTTNGNSFSEMSIPDQNSGAWITPLAIDPSNNQNVYVGYNRIHKSTNQGGTWTTISGNISSNDLTWLFVAPSNGNTLYAGTSSTFLRSTDGGVTWTTMTSPGNGLQEIVVHPTNPNTVWAVRSNYTAGEKVFKSVNGGSTWTNVSGNLPNLPVNCITYQTGTDDGLYIGMDVGVYYRDNTMANWEVYNTGLPNVRIRDLKIKYNTQELFAGTYGRGAWKTPLRNATNCQTVNNINVSSIDLTTATIGWTPPSPTPANGYEVGITTTATPPNSGTTTSNTTLSFVGLNTNTGYYFHVRCICEDNEQSPWVTSGPHMTRTTCGDISSDTGGTSNNYTDNENTIRYVCPGGPYQQAVLTFTDFDVESGWDALYVYNGNNINSPLFSSGNPATQAGFPAGGWYGTTLPGPFTSTHPSGCLTLQFRSDESVTGRGWAANTTCINNCTFSVRNTNDDGPNSLRYAMTCAVQGSTIVFDEPVHNSTITLQSPILVTKNLTISMSNENTTIRSIHPGYLFEILPGVTLTLNNVHFIGGSGTGSTRVLLNRGNLLMTDVDILDVLAGSGSGKTIDNQGNATINGLYQIRTN